MKDYSTMLVLIVLLFSCSDGNNQPEYSGNRYKEYENNYRNDYEESGYDDYHIAEDEYDAKVFDGEYCAEIIYYNSNTGRESNYTLTIEVYDNVLERINFPNGWLDTDHYGYVEFNEDGYVSFTSDRGYDYTVQIIGEAYGCFVDVPRAYQCRGITKDGNQCKHLTDNPSGYCWQHEDQDY